MFVWAARAASRIVNQVQNGRLAQALDQTISSLLSEMDGDVFQRQGTVAAV